MNGNASEPQDMECEINNDNLDMTVSQSFGTKIFKIPINETCTKIEPCPVVPPFWNNDNYKVETDYADIYNKTEYFLNYLPNVSKFQANSKNSIKLMAYYGFFRDKQVYKNLSKINSFILSNVHVTAHDADNMLEHSKCKNYSSNSWQSVAFEMRYS